MDQAASRLLGVDPSPDLEHGESEHAYIDYVPDQALNLDPVTDGKGLAGEYQQPTGHVLEYVGEGNSYAG